MYEEEYYVSVLPQKDDVLVYKYFSELVPGQLDDQPEDPQHLERGNVLGQSSTSIMPWASPSPHAELEMGFGGPM